MRSAGISSQARHQLEEQDLQWAQWVIVVDQAQEGWIRDTVTLGLQRISDIGISDDVLVDDPELRVQLREGLAPLLGPPPGAPREAPRRRRPGD